ncbi:hypothetical protein EYF80_027576 [Liparis tanakae]|uniref:Uncharacterized protein n=1 Tax=Liparis tanakae TaxID=230148 RepID=A0A4Z2H8U2_9TELE|nr:hypothetical protein EYF80_027576 [Liparis tanakae]
MSCVHAAESASVPQTGPTSTLHIAQLWRQGLLPLLPRPYGFSNRNKHGGGEALGELGSPPV